MTFEGRFSLLREAQCHKICLKFVQCTDLVRIEEYMFLLKSYRAILVLNVLIIFLQFVLAGQMIGGSDVAVNLHSATGLLLILVGLVQMSLAIAMMRRGIGPGWLILANVGIVLAEAIEAVCGHFRLVSVHVPLALAIFGGVLRQLFWSVREASADREQRA